MNWSEDEFNEILKKNKSIKVHEYKKKTSPIEIEQEEPTKNKYSSLIIRRDGIKFRSLKEANYYSDLKLLLMAGEIKGFCIQPKFILVEGNEEERAITYSADFIVFKNDDTFEIVDTKGYDSPQWKRTFKQFRLKYPKLDLKVIK